MNILDDCVVGWFAGPGEAETHLVLEPAADLLHWRPGDPGLMASLCCTAILWDLRDQDSGSRPLVDH